MRTLEDFNEEQEKIEEREKISRLYHEIQAQRQSAGNYLTPTAGKCQLCEKVALLGAGKDGAWCCEDCLS